MGVSCDFDGCSVDELGSVQQLEMHAAFKHVPFDELVFVCSRCPHKPQFGTPTQLLKHKAATHQGAAPVPNDIPASVLGPSAASNQEPAPRATQPASVAKTKRFQCNRCAYGTNHSAWLLQKHVIYEHLVDQLGHAHEHDPGLNVPKVAKPIQKSEIKCEMSSVQHEEPYDEQPGGFYNGEMEQDEQNDVAHEDVAADAAQLCDRGHDTMTQQKRHSAENAAYGDYDGDQTNSGNSGPKQITRRADYGEAIACLTKSGKHPLYRYDSKTHPGHIYEFSVLTTKRNGQLRYAREAAAAMLEWGSILQPHQVVQRFRDELLSDPELTDEQRQAAINSFRLNKMRSTLGRRRAIALSRSAHCAKVRQAPAQQAHSSRSAGAGHSAAGPAESSASSAARCGLGNQK